MAALASVDPSSTIMISRLRQDCASALSRVCARKRSLLYRGMIALTSIRSPGQPKGWLDLPSPRGALRAIENAAQRIGQFRLFDQRFVRARQVDHVHTAQ